VDNLGWLPVGLIGLVMVIVLTNYMSMIRLRKRLAKAWDGERFFIKKDTEESLVDGMLLASTIQPTDSQVDDQTWYDLALHKVFDQLNYTQSSIGAEALYQKMRLLTFQPDDSLRELEEFFERQPDLRLRVQVIMNQLGKKNHNMARSIVANPGNQDSRIYLSLYIFLACLPVLSLFFLPFFKIQAFSVLIASVTFNIIFSSIRNWSNKTRLDQVSYLVRLFASAEKLSRLALPKQEALKQAVQPFKKTKVISSILQSPTGNSEMEIILIYLNFLFLIPQIAQVYIYNQVKSYQKEAQETINLLGEMEVAISLLRHKRDFELICQPHFSKEGGIRGKSLYHPLIANPVVNDVSFEKNMVISGDNASGKSTYLKMVAINCILAQGLGFAYGESFELPYGHVMTSMDVSDDIEVGDSYFITESKTILRMIENLKKPGFHYFFIDELFKGTNTIERIGAGLGIVRWLSGRNCLYMISSHDIELVVASGAVNDNYHFDSRYVDGKIVFDYHIKQGSAVTKNAVNTLKSLHFPSEITLTAQELIEQYEETGKWSLKRMLN
jgi:possible DNA mismatch repair protein mutS